MVVVRVRRFRRICPCGSELGNNLMERSDMNLKKFCQEGILRVFFLSSSQISEYSLRRNVTFGGPKLIF
jgi:hypothetical protein